jgi:hypothetical protein
MKKLIIPVFVALAAFAFTQSAAAASTAAKPMTAQQSKFAACAHKSKGMKGAAHKKFMHECLKGKSTDKSAKTEAKHDKDAKGGRR